MFPAQLSTTFLAIAIVAAACTPSAVAQNCTKPSVRREWRALTKRERTAWIDGIKCLAAQPHDSNLVQNKLPVPTLKSSSPYYDPGLTPNTVIPDLNSSSSFYDDLVYMHIDINSAMHDNGLFSPYHRMLVHLVETSMKEKCNYTGAMPYWDISKDAADFPNSSMFDPDDESGLGGWGDPENDFQVSTGAFAHNFTLSYPAPHGLRRNYTNQPYLARPDVYPIPDLMANTTFTDAEVQKMTEGWTANFSGLGPYLDGVQTLRGGIHLIMGGDSAGMCPQSAGPNCTQTQTTAPNEPLFWLYHGIMDKIWYDWQNRDVDANFWDFRSTNATQEWGFDTELPTNGLFPQPTIGDMMNSTGGYLCYVYE